MYRIYGRIIRYFLFPVSGWIPDLPCRISGRITDDENSRISGQIEEITIAIHKIFKNVFLKPLLFSRKKMLPDVLSTGKENLLYI
jgi:hypothetical protein